MDLTKVLGLLKGEQVVLNEGAKGSEKSKAEVAVGSLDRFPQRQSGKWIVGQGARRSFVFDTSEVAEIKITKNGAFVTLYPEGAQPRGDPK